MKKKTLIEALLVEYIEVNGANFIANSDGWDIFDMTTFDACQEFKVGNTTNVAGTAFVQSASTFNSNINETIKLYFIVKENTNKVFLAVLLDRGAYTIKNAEDVSIATCNFTIENTVHAANKLPADIPLSLFSLIPNANVQPITPDETPSELTDEEPLENNIEPEVNDEEENVEDVVEPEEDSEEETEEESAEESEEVIEEDPQEEYELSAEEQAALDILKIKIVGNEAIIVGYDEGGDNKIIVPEFYKNVPITKVASYAFFDYGTDSKRVYIIKMPYIKFIYKDAFYGAAVHVGVSSDVKRTKSSNDKNVSFFKL